MRLIRQVLHQSDLVPVETIDEDASSAAYARNINEILEIFVRVNTGGTRLSRSDLMFSLLKSKWKSARLSFDELLRDVEKKGKLGLDKDFIIRGLLTVADGPPKYEVENVQRHWPTMEAAFEQFSKALRSAVDFCQSADVGIRSQSLFDASTLFPIVYYLYHHKNGSVPDDQRKPLRCFLYFLLFNDFLRRPEARIRYLRTELQKHKGKSLPLNELLDVIRVRQTHNHTCTSAEMLNSHPRLALNIAQPAVCRETLSWQEQAEVDHIFPQSKVRARFPDLVDDIGNLAYLGKLRNIRKTDQMPAEYFKSMSDDELKDEYLIDDRAVLAEDTFAAFVEARRQRIVERVIAFLGR